MKQSRSPWAWVPTLYIFEGLPYFIVNTISVVMLKRLGLGNADVAMYTGLLYLPWVIKPLWSPFVDVLRTKRWWIITMQVLMCAGIWCSAFFVNSQVLAKGADFYLLLGFFYLTAFASATHDIAADGFYMLALNEHSATQFVGIRNTFYRIASIFGQGVLVVLAGAIETASGNIPQAWRLTLIIAGVILAMISLYHIWFMPCPADDRKRFDCPSGKKAVLSELGRSFATFFQKKGVWLAILFMLLYRLPEALTIKMINPFFLDARSDGGLGFTTEQVGLIYGTFGAVSLIAGGIIGGLVAGRFGLRKCLWPMALSLTLPCIVFLLMAIYQPDSVWLVGAGVCLDQFGYGFGFTAYTLYMMYFARGEFKTSHYSICTAFMALSMMIPGMFAGLLQEAVGYRLFFWIVIACFAATFAVLLPLRIDTEYGKKN